MVYNIYSKIQFSKSMEHQKLAHFLEILCQSGCETVNATIKAMENGQTCSVTEQLTPVERNIVLAELKAIMAVYDQ